MRISIQTKIALLLVANFPCPALSNVFNFFNNDDGDHHKHDEDEGFNFFDFMNNAKPSDSKSDSNSYSSDKGGDIYLVQDFEEIGVVSPIRTWETVEEFYNYKAESFHGPSDIPLSGKRSVIFLHQNARNDDLSLVIIHSNRFGGNLMSSCAMYISGDLWNPVVKDDPEFTRFMLADDEYDQLYLRRKGMTRIQWYWSFAETDGMAHRLPDPDFRGCIEVDADFENLTQEGQVVTFGGIEEWKFVTSDKKTIDLRLDEPLYICIGRDKPYKDSEDGDNPFPPADLACLDEEPVCGYCERPGMYNTLVCKLYWTQTNCVVLYSRVIMPKIFF